MGASYSRSGRSMSTTNSSQSMVIPLGAKPPNVNLRVDQCHGESSAAACAVGPAGNSEVGGVFSVSPPSSSVFVVDSGEDSSDEYLTVLDDETGLALQDVNYHSCTSFASGLGSRHQLQSPLDPKRGAERLE